MSTALCCKNTEMKKTTVSRFARSSFLVAVGAVACIGAYCSAAQAADTRGQVKPAQVEVVAGTTLKRVTLTPKAAERLGIEIDEVRVDPSGRRIVPYASILYDLTGKTWVYISADPLTFFRGAVEIDTIKGDNVYLTDGPPGGTKVLATGVPQVFGTEVKVGH